MRGVTLAVAGWLLVGGSPSARADAPLRLDPASLIGAWSFDRSCASGDGMLLSADGSAAFDEWGSGLWAVSASGRLVLVLRNIAPEALGERVVLELAPSAPAGDELAGRFAEAGPAHPAREIRALRCP